MNVDSPATWLQLLQWDPFIKLAPAVVSTMLLMLVMARFKSPLALPAVLVFLPGLFFMVLACLHKSLVDAQDGGWVAKPSVGLCYLCVYLCVGACMLLACRQAAGTQKGYTSGLCCLNVAWEGSMCTFGKQQNQC